MVKQDSRVKDWCDTNIGGYEQRLMQNAIAHTGFVNFAQDVWLKYDPITHIMSIEPNTVNGYSFFTYYIYGIEYKQYTSLSVNANVYNQAGSYIVTIDTPGHLGVSSSEFPWGFQVAVAIVVFDLALDSFVIQELHSCAMEASVQAYVASLGDPKLTAQGTFINGSINPVSPIDSDNQFLVDAYSAISRDIQWYVPFSSPFNSNKYIHLYRQEFVPNYGNYAWDSGTSFPFMMGTTYPIINKTNGYGWSLFETSSGKFFNVYVYTLNAFLEIGGYASDYSVLFQTGYVEYTSKAQAISFDQNDIFLDVAGYFFTTRLLPLFKVTFETNSAWTSTGKCRIVNVRYMSKDNFDANGNLLLDDTNEFIGGGEANFGTIPNYSHFEPDGTIVFNGTATVWKDIFFPMGTPKSTGAGNPTLTTWNTIYKNYSFAINDSHDFDPQEFSHDGKVGATTAQWHIHFTSLTNVNAIRYVKYQIDYIQIGIGGAFPTTTTISAEQSIPANTPANTHYLLNIGSPFTTLNPGTMLCARLTRITASGTAPASDPIVLGIHFHYEVDTIGSRLITTK